MSQSNKPPSKVKQILHDYYYGIAPDIGPEERDYDWAEATILAWHEEEVRRIIGSDDREHEGVGGAVPAGRNKLRKEQRKRAGLTEGKEQ